MKFTELLPEKQELVTAYINGWTIQIKDTEGEWVDAHNSLYCISTHNTEILRVKPKEPVVTCLYSAVDKYGNIEYDYESDDMNIINEYYEHTELLGYIKRTFHDGKFINLEFIPLAF